jgi:hypothetical protein
MRALIVSLVLFVAAAICMTFVVLFAGLNANSATLASMGLGIFMVAALFAAIAALGPKSQPTPLLTPAIAGTVAAALTTAAIITASVRGVEAHRAALRIGEPAEVATPLTEEPSAASPPAPVQFPGVAIVPAAQTPLPILALPADVMALEPPMPESIVEPQSMPPEANAAATMVDDTSAGASPADTPDQMPLPAGRPQSRDSADGPIPIPPIPPASTAGRVLSEAAFDTSGPPTVRESTSAASPPLPRSRPCGAGGPPCP